MQHRAKGSLLLMATLLVATIAKAAPDISGALLATGGATSIEATAGGGITTWAVLSGYGTNRQTGCAAAFSGVVTDDYKLDVIGAACTINQRIELSVGRQRLDLDGLRPVLGLPSNQMLRQHYFGAKVRLAGDVVYNKYGQLSLGAVYKENEDGGLAKAAGAARTSDTEFYISGGKLILDGPFGWMSYVNLTLRLTRANQTGLLGFGGDRDSKRGINGEVAAALFPRRDLAFGMEYRQKPDNLSFAGEDDWYDVFVAWFPNKHVSLVGAWTELGSIGTLDHQAGPYLSLAGSF